MSKKVLLVDMDGTLARFHDEVDYLERMYEEGFFLNLLPFENVVAAIRLFMEDHPEIPVYTCTAAINSPFCIPEKEAWLDTFLPEIRKENRIYSEPGKSKAEYLDLETGPDIFLLDDYNKGLHMFQFDSGSAIKCHNNINQKGLGTHGGERGYMWDGPMIHAGDPPGLIAEELSQLMALEHSIDKAARACHVQMTETALDLVHFTQHHQPTHAKYLSLFSHPSRGEGYRATITDGQDREDLYFRNPFNAIRYLNGDHLAKEHSMILYDGERVTASGYQLQAICQNAYGDINFTRYIKADHAQMAEEVKQSISHKGHAIVGFVCEVSPTGEDFAHTTYYNHTEMLRRIEACKSRGQAHRAEWFVPPTPDRTLHSKSLSARIQSAQQRVNNSLNNPTLERTQTEKKDV